MEPKEVGRDEEEKIMGAEEDGPISEKQKQQESGTKGASLPKHEFLREDFASTMSKNQNTLGKTEDTFNQREDKFLR